ncbi:MAG: hypothetical protein Q4G68_13155 [Planctomycetia bacterium]|nr:hypothetical protein [Planctomycetia bacterium]
MLKRISFWLFASCFAGILCIIPCRGEESTSGADAACQAVAEVDQTEEFIRLDTPNGSTIRGLLTPIHHMAGTINDREITVDLVAAVHYGEPEYYEELNRRFRDYDAVLFELVMPKSATVESEPDPASRTTRSPLAVIAVVQQWFGTTLGLTSQMEGIDYQASNFVHADMDAETFLAEILRKGEVFDFFYKTAIESFDAGEGVSDQTFLAAMLFAKDRRKTLRRLFARQLVQAFDVSSLSEEESTLISARNQIALTRLREQAGAGKTHLAVFYGAAHLPDLQKRLETEFGFKRESTEWLHAWKM